MFDPWKQSKIQNAFHSMKEWKLPDQDTSISDLRKLAGVDGVVGEQSNISMTGTEKVQLMKQHNIQPGTDAWFRLWFSKPHLTGETPIADK